MLVAIVEDDENDAKTLSEYLHKYAEEEKTDIGLKIFHDGMNFVSDYKPVYDIVFFDVEMPYMNGLEAAAKIREIDDTVVIVFVTNMAQYAIRGYEVAAVDFLIKPVSYGNFVDRLKRAIRYVSRHAERPLLLGNSADGFIRVESSEIIYAEKQKNYVLYHTVKGDFSKRENLSETETALENLTFSRINSGCIVNLKCVEKVDKDAVVIASQSLPLSRRRKQEFIDEYMRYLSGFSCGKERA